MTEAEWLVCDDPTPMRRFLEGHADERKLRLFCCACCRAVWHLLPDARSRHAVEVAERYADGRAGLVELARARADALRVAGRGSRQTAWAAYWAANTKAAGIVRNVCYASAGGSAWTASQASAGKQAAAYAATEVAGTRAQAALLREVFGNPFRPPRLDPAWRAWEGGTVARLAEGIYDDRAFDRLPILADALEEAGCADEALLTHCRAPGEHVRGCWALDATLGER